MLQQTVAKVVVPYFEKWMQIFPNIESLASAAEETVIKIWEGLGYYSRAVNLRKGALDIINRFHGKLPQDLQSLCSIKGIGPYTARAVLAFAFGEKIAPVDGNVLRVLSRYFLIEDTIDSRKGYLRISGLADELLPDNDPFVTAEALIELGATVCKKQPVCRICPLKDSCRAYRFSLYDQFPKKSCRRTVSNLFRFVGIVMSDQGVLLQKKTEKLMAGLYEFPYVEVDEDLFLEKISCYNSILPVLADLSWDFHEELPMVKQVFTSFKAKLRPFSFKAQNIETRSDFYSWEAVSSLAFSSGHRRILQFLRKK